MVLLPRPFLPCFLPQFIFQTIGVTIKQIMPVYRVITEGRSSLISYFSNIQTKHSTLTSNQFTEQLFLMPTCQNHIFIFTSFHFLLTFCPFILPCLVPFSFCLSTWVLFFHVSSCLPHVSIESHWLLEADDSLCSLHLRTKASLKAFHAPL